MKNKESNSGHKKIGKYLMKKIIGKGEFGTVYYSIDTETNKEFAIKSQSKKLLDDSSNYKRLLNTEIKIMISINHPNILKLHDLFETTNNYYLVVDYCN